MILKILMAAIKLGQPTARDVAFAAPGSRAKQED